MVILVMRLHHQMGAIFQGTTNFKPSCSNLPPFTPTLYHFHKFLFTSSLFEPYTSQPLLLSLSTSRIFKLLTAHPFQGNHMSSLKKDGMQFAQLLLDFSFEFATIMISGLGF
jgi:hypothetical protein